MVRDRITKNEHKKLEILNLLQRTDVLYSAGLPYEINVRNYHVKNFE